MKLRDNGSDCRACFLKGCICECRTCISARERNEKMDTKTLDWMNFMDAFRITIEPEEEGEETK